MNIWDSRAKTKTVTGYWGAPEKRYRRAEWSINFDRTDWRIGIWLQRKYGSVEINLPMIQFCREPWYDKEPK